MSSSIILALGLAPVAEISDSNDGQDASGLAPDPINFVKNQTFDYSFVSSAGLAPAVLTIENMMGSDLPIRFGPVGFWYNIHKLILTGGISLNVNDLCPFSSPVEEKKKLKFAFSSITALVWNYYFIFYFFRIL